jgi:hypothetical protein
MESDHWDRMPRTSLYPLSRALRHYQQVNLYCKVEFTREVYHLIEFTQKAVRIVKLYNSLKTSGLGGLVRHLFLKLNKKEMDAFFGNQESKDALAAITNLLPQLRSISCIAPNIFVLRSPFLDMVGNAFLDGVGKFDDLESVDLSSTTSSYLQLLEMKKLNKPSLIINEELGTQEQGNKGAGQLTRLSLDKLSIRGHFSPLAIKFVQSIDTVDTSLDVENGDPLATLTAISDSIRPQSTLIPQFIISSSYSHLTTRSIFATSTSECRW